MNTILLIDFHLHSVSLINALMMPIFIFFFLVSVVDRASWLSNRELPASSARGRIGCIDHGGALEVSETNGD